MVSRAKSWYVNRMRHTHHDHFRDPYHNDGPVEGVYDAMTYVDSVAAAENPQWQQATDPNTGQPLYYADGTPVVYQVPLHQQMAATTRRRLLRLQWIRSVILTAPILFAAYIAVIMFGPPALGQLLQETVMPIVAHVMVWTAGLTMGLVMVTAVLRVVWHAFFGRPRD